MYWYSLYLPAPRLNSTRLDSVRLLQQVAAELLKRYCDHYYNYCKRAYLEPRLELRELTPADGLIPKEDSYQLIVDGDEAQIIQGIEQLKQELAQHKKDLLQTGDLRAVQFHRHLFQPLFHVRRGGKITVLPVSLNESEFRFVTELKKFEPHGLLHEGPASEKVLFHQRIKDVERRLNDPAVTLNSFILSWTRHP